MPPKPWKTLSTREVYKNRWMRPREDVAEMPDGRTTIYGVCELGEWVGVVPFVSDDEVVMVRQYRYIQKEDWRWEMPTGGVYPGESGEEAAQRELMEEVGYRAGSLEWTGSFNSSKSVCDETCHLYVGRDLTVAKGVPEATEFVEVVIMPLAEVAQMVLTSEIRDAMTVIAVLHAAHLRGLSPGAPLQ